MASVADTETAMRIIEARIIAETVRNDKSYNRRLLVAQLCVLAVPLAVIICCVTTIVLGIEWQKDNERYASPQFNLTSLDASHPSALVLGDEVVARGWVACFSARNPNPKTVSYARANAVVWGRRVDVTPFKQAPYGGGVVCAGFPGDTMMKMETNETAWIGTVRFNADIRYKGDAASVEVRCKDVRVLVRGECDRGGYGA